MLYTDHKLLEKLGHLHTKTLNLLQAAMLDYDFTIQYKKGINMQAYFLSCRTINNLCVIDPFTPDLFAQQAVDPDVIKLKHFSQHASWPNGTPKSVANRIAPLVSKIFSQDTYGFDFRTITGNKIPYYCQPDTENVPCVKQTVIFYPDTMLISKPTFISLTSTFGPP